MYRTPIVLTLILVGGLIGCSEEGDAEALGQSLGESVTEFAQGVGGGVDTQLKIDVELSDAIKKRGVTTTVAKQIARLDSPEKSISVYFITTNAISATFQARAYDKDDKEIGRATADVKFAADDAQYIEFQFPREMDQQMVKVYRVDSRPLANDGNAEAAE